MTNPSFWRTTPLVILACAVAGCGGGGGGGGNGGGGGGGGASFRGVGDLAGGVTSSGLQAANSNGSTVGGFGSPDASPATARWTLPGGLTALAGVGSGQVYGISGDGTVFVGFRDTAGIQAFSWTQAGGVQTLPVIPGGTGPTTAFGISSNGSVIVGQGREAGGEFRAAKWIAGVVTDLGVLAGGNTSTARAADADGSVIVGTSATVGGTRAVRWIGGNPVSIIGTGTLPGGSQAAANAVNSDGSVIVGESATNVGGTHTAAFRHTAATGFVDLGDLPGGGLDSRALGVSGDGSIVVGEGETALGSEAFIWTQAGGMQNLKTYLTGLGLGGSLTGWTLVRATAISQDGNVIVGSGTSPGGTTEGWIAVLS